MAQEVPLATTGSGRRSGQASGAAVSGKSQPSPAPGVLQQNPGVSWWAQAGHGAGRAGQIAQL